MRMSPIAGGCPSFPRKSTRARPRFRCGFPIGRSVYNAESKAVRSGGAMTAIVADEQQAATAIPEVDDNLRSEEHTSELKSLMRISYAVFCVKQQTIIKHHEILKPMQG